MLKFNRAAENPLRKRILIYQKSLNIFQQKIDSGKNRPKSPLDLLVKGNSTFPQVILIWLVSVRSYVYLHARIFPQTHFEKGKLISSKYVHFQTLFEYIYRVVPPKKI